MKSRINFFAIFFLLAFTGMLKAQVMVEDTSTNQPFFKAKKFKSACYVGFEGAVTQVLKKKAGLNLGLNLNWVINHKYVISAHYYGLTTPLNIKNIVRPDVGDSIQLSHQFAGLGFSYILFADKKFSFQPELVVGWAGAKYVFRGTTYRTNFAEIIPAVYGIYNATKYFRLGVGLNYRAAAGLNFNGLKSADISGVSGIVFIRVGTF